MLVGIREHTGALGLITTLGAIECPGLVGVVGALFVFWAAAGLAFCPGGI